MAENVNLSATQPSPLVQFSLWHLFLFTTAAACYATCYRWLGPVPPMLMVGLLLVVAAVGLLRIENFIAGAVLGTGIAVVLLIVILMAAEGPWANPLLVFCYPLAGYFLGMATAADRAFRSF